MALTAAPLTPEDRPNHNSFAPETPRPAMATPETQTSNFGPRPALEARPAEPSETSGEKKIETAPSIAPPEQTETKLAAPAGKESFLEETIARLRQTLRGRKAKPSKIPPVRDQMTEQIENIMSEGLTDAFLELTPVAQQEFKLKGEQTAWQIRTLLKQTKVKIKKIFQLLLEWLRLLPGINRLFLEQEAKIKSDKIIALHNPKL